jgi:hypothetical protein
LKKWICLLSLLFVSNVFASKNGNYVTFFADALWWQMQESNASNWGQILYPGNANQTITFLGVPFKSGPGLRVGVGLSGQDNSWNILFYYTGYKSRATSQASTETGEIHSSFSSNYYANNQQGNGITGPYYRQASIQWNLTYNIFDLELGKKMTLGKLVDLRPFIGLRSGFINQSINSQWFNPPPVQGVLTPAFTAATEKVTNDFSGLGPSAGIDATLHLYTAPTYGFNLIGNLSGAFMIARWRFSDNYQNDTPQAISTISDSIFSATSMAKGYIGLAWSCFSKDTNWNVSLGYEEQVWFNQLQYYSFDMGKTNDTLYLSGAVLGLDVKF